MQMSILQVHSGTYKLNLFTKLLKTIHDIRHVTNGWQSVVCFASRRARDFFSSLEQGRKSVTTSFRPCSDAGGSSCVPGGGVSSILPPICRVINIMNPQNIISVCVCVPRSHGFLPVLIFAPFPYIKGGWGVWE